MTDTKDRECRKCGGAMRPGVAIEQTYSAGAPDFPGDTHGVTMSPAGPGQLIDCSKCEACGWSVTAASAHIHLAWRGALKACGVGEADRDAISDVVIAMLGAPAKEGAETYPELSATERAQFFGDLRRAFPAQAAAAPAPEREPLSDEQELIDGSPVAYQVRYRSLMTPARIAFDGQNHYREWSDWDPCTVSYAKAVTDPQRNREGSDAIYEARPLFLAARKAQGGE